MAAAPKLVGPDAARARALAKRPRKAKFALGELVLEPHGELGAVDAVFADLEAAENAGVIEDAADWLGEQEKRPRTPRGGLWYSVVLGNGAALVGEDDLRRAPKK